MSRSYYLGAESVTTDVSAASDMRSVPAPPAVGHAQRTTPTPMSGRPALTLPFALDGAGWPLDGGCVHDLLAALHGDERGGEGEVLEDARYTGCAAKAMPSGNARTMPTLVVGKMGAGWHRTNV